MLIWLRRVMSSIHVVHRIAPECNRPAVEDHPTVQVLVAEETDGNDAAEAVEIAGLTAHGGTPDVIGQREAALLSTTPALVGGPHAQLAAFGASIPKNRIRWPWTSIVSPSMTEATPTMRSCATAIEMTDSAGNRPNNQNIRDHWLTYT